MNKALITHLSRWALASLMLVSLSAHAQVVPSAFSYVSNGVVSDRSFKQSNSTSSSVSSWQIQLNNKVAEQAVGSNFELTMPDGEVLIAQVTTRKKFGNGGVQLQAAFGKGGNVILTIGAKATYGSITSQTHNFSFSIDESNHSVLIDNQTLPAGSTDVGDDMVIPDAAKAKQSSSKVANEVNRLQASTSIGGKSNVDVLFVYNAEFKELFDLDPEARIAQLVAFSNMSYHNTDILINLRSVGAVEVGFTNGDRNSNSTLLNAVASGSGAFSGVAQLRDETGADLVAVLGTSSPGSASGIAFLLTNFAPSNPFDLETARFDANGSSGFSFTRLSLNCCDTVFTHEIGHNLGSGHEGPLVNANANVSRCNGGFTGFSCGHGNTERPDNWGTIMSNINGGRAAIQFRFSNLDNTCVGEPCGIAPGLSGPEQAADNRTSFNITRLIVSGFRDQVQPDPEPEPNPNPQPNPDSPEDCTFFVIKSTADAGSVVCL